MEELRIWKIRQFTHQSRTAERLGLDWTWVCFQRDEQKFLRGTHAEGNELVPAPLEVKRARGLESPSSLTVKRTAKRELVDLFSVVPERSKAALRAFDSGWAVGEIPSRTFILF